MIEIIELHEINSLNKIALEYAVIFFDNSESEYSSSTIQHT